ncbi:MAG: HEAT repeat domain-containing protein [Parachlamydiaceae bacterium]
MLRLKILCAAVLLFPSYTQGEDESAITRRINAHLVIKDENSALIEAQKAIKNHPYSKNLRQAYIKVLAQLGQEDKAWQALKEYGNLFPKDAMNRELIEALSWGAIQKGAASPSPILRIFSLIAAYQSDDAKGVSIVHKALDDSNTLVRRVAVEVAGSLKDAKIGDKILQMLLQERDWTVRQGVLEATGKIKLKQAEKHLIYLVASPTAAMEEKAAASQALLYLLETVERKELLNLARSSRGDLRKLSAMMIAHLGVTEHRDLLFDLLQDPQAEVRRSALQGIGTMIVDRPLNDEWAERVEQLRGDLDPEVAIYAAWVAGRWQPEKIQDYFNPFIHHDKRSVRILASSALASLGQRAHPFLLNCFEECQDQFVKMNLGMALIKERIAHEKGLEALYQGLSQNKERWMLKDYQVFSAIAPSDLKHQPMISNYPEVANQLVRLDVINTLAMMRHPAAKNALQSFLKERSWGITGLAASTLLTEGDEAAIELVQDLLNDNHPKIRIQAALVLSLWGGDRRAINTLQNAYRTASRELKEQILEGLGRIGQHECLPFLVDKMGESYQSLRIMAASSILQCLYH